MKKKIFGLLFLFLITIGFFISQAPGDLSFIRDMSTLALKEITGENLTLNSVIQEYDQVEHPYYRDKLDPKEKKIYDKIKLALANPEKKIILNQEITDDQYDNIIWLVWADNPDFSQNLINSLAGHSTPLISYIVMEYNQQDYKEYLERSHQAYGKAQTIVKEIPAQWSDYQKVKYLHDYLVNHCIPNVNDKNNPLNNEAYGALMLGRAMCEGYTNAMQLLCNLAGIENTVVSYNSYTNAEGQEVEGHTWNLIKMDDSYYHVDVGSDDPIEEISSGHQTAASLQGYHYVSYQYFGLTTAEIDQLHGIPVGKTFEKLMPSCTATKDNYYVVEGLLFNDYDQNNVAKAMAETYLKEAAEQNILTSARFTNRESYQKALTDSDNLCKALLHYLNKSSGEFGSRSSDSSLTIEKIIFF